MHHVSLAASPLSSYAYSTRSLEPLAKDAKISSHRASMECVRSGRRTSKIEPWEKLKLGTDLRLKLKLVHAGAGAKSCEPVRRANSQY